MKQLAEDEAKNIAEARDMALDERVTPSVLISTAINLEREQYVVSYFHKWLK